MYPSSTSTAITTTSPLSKGKWNNSGGLLKVLELLEFVSRLSQLLHQNFLSLSQLSDITAQKIIRGKILPEILIVWIRDQWK